MGDRKYEPIISKVPYHALVVYSTLFCSGALISSRIVVSTASCFVSWNPSINVIVKFGSDTIRGDGVIVEVSEVKLHEYYEYQGRMANDISLIFLQNHVSFKKGSVQKALLARLNPNKNDMITITSWTKANVRTSFENFLVQLRMEVMGEEQCREILRALSYQSNFCALYRGINMGRLPHDSGSPAMTDRQLLSGILSFVFLDERMANIGVFTNISYFYRWIMINSKRMYMQSCYTLNPNDLERR